MEFNAQSSTEGAAQGELGGAAPSALIMRTPEIPA
jgi:hypothetical protein